MAGVEVQRVLKWKKSKSVVDTNLVVDHVRVSLLQLDHWSAPMMILDYSQIRCTWVPVVKAGGMWPLTASRRWRRLQATLQSSEHTHTQCGDHTVQFSWRKRRRSVKMWPLIQIG